MQKNKDYIVQTIVKRFSTDQQKREEALREVMALTHQDLSDQALADLAQAIPPLPPELYEKWACLFAEKMLATVDPSHIQELCVPDQANQSTLALLFAMFMESETMEKQKATDLKEYQSVIPKQ